jgi:hypothetical protein
MKEDIAATCRFIGRAADRLSDSIDSQILNSANSVASRTPLPRLRYTVSDFDRTWRGKLLQIIVDRLHSRGD